MNYIRIPRKKEEKMKKKSDVLFTKMKKYLSEEFKERYGISIKTNEISVEHIVDAMQVNPKYLNIKISKFNISEKLFLDNFQESDDTEKFFEYQLNPIMFRIHNEIIRSDRNSFYNKVVGVIKDCRMEMEKQNFPNREITLYMNYLDYHKLVQCSQYENTSNMGQTEFTTFMGCKIYIVSDDEYTFRAYAEPV